MKEVIKFFLIVAVTVVVADIFVGAGMKYYIDNTSLKGDYESIDHLVKNNSDEAIIIGSSIALNSTVPSIITDSIGVSCWNAGSKGQFFPYYESMLEIILTHHNPKYILLGLRDNELSRVGTGARYNILAPYYGLGYTTIDKNLDEGSCVKRALLGSALYRYNGAWFHMIAPTSEKCERGFVGRKVPPYLPILVENEDVQARQECVDALLRMIKRCKEAGTQLVVYFPPVFGTTPFGTMSSVKTAEEICKQNGVRCYNDYNDSLFIQHPEWYSDNRHLNRNGAIVFSQRFGAWLKASTDKERK